MGALEPLAQFLGVQVVEAAPGRVVLELAMRAEFATAKGASARSGRRFLRPTRPERLN